MINLIILFVVISVTAAFYVLRRSSLLHSRIEKFAFICLYCVSLGLALRFGGRTYPGIYLPHSTYLNDLLNGNFLFVVIGYLAVLVAGAADTLLIISRPKVRGFAVVLKTAKFFAICLATAISLYGFWIAATMQRLP